MTQAVTPSTPSRRNILALAGGAAACDLGRGRAAGAGADADLIQLCARHPALKVAFEADDRDDECSPHWRAYIRNCDAILAAKPVTTEGLRAKARVAIDEAGGDAAGSEAGEWGMAIARDLLRLA